MLAAAKVCTFSDLAKDFAHFLAAGQAGGV